MLKTCDICHRRDYCDSCALAEDCYWIKVAPVTGGGDCRASLTSVNTTTPAARLK